MSIAKVVVIAVVVIFSSVNISNAAPSGSDKNVVDTVLKLATGELEKMLPVRCIMEARDQLKHKNDPYYYNDAMLRASYDSTHGTYFDGTDPKIAEITQCVLKKLAIAEMKLEYIRADYIDDSINKSFNSAQLNINGVTTTIEYTAQEVPEGIYIEVLFSDREFVDNVVEVIDQIYHKK